MKTIDVDSFTLSKEYIDLLLNELKNDRVTSVEDLAHYLKNHSYVKDNARKCHLLVANRPNKRNFAIPFED